jgi:hypothetical protein
MPAPWSITAGIDAGLDRASRILVAAASAILVLHWALVIAFVVPRLGTLTFLRLHYSAAQGVDWLGDWRALFVFPGIGAAALLVNVPLAASLGRTRRGLCRLVLTGTLVIEAFLAVGGTLAVLLNG